MKDSRLKNASVTSGPRPSNNTSVKDAITAMKYSMTRPSVSIYPLDDTLTHKTFPDYSPWEEDDDLNKKLDNLNYLNKGFFETPRVSNEYYSARNLVQETVFSSSKNCNGILRELSQHLTKSYKTRDEVINKIRASSFSFKIPLRVTLTALKKEAWLRDLADTDQPLHKISSRIPHGLRNKVLVDAMCTRHVPIARAIWFTKCSLFSELIQVKKKAQARQLSLLLTGTSLTSRTHEIIERRWLQEWTQQVADYIFKFSKEMRGVSSQDLKNRFQERMNYLMAYVQTLYIEELLDKTFFLTLILRLLREDHSTGKLSILTIADIYKGDTIGGNENLFDILSQLSSDLGQLLIALVFIKVFWKDILAESFLCKHLGESLLLNFLIVSKIPSLKHAPHHLNFAVADHIKSECLTLLSEMVVEIFQKNSSAFIIPSSWIVLGDVLQDIIKGSDLYVGHTKGFYERSLALLRFRNESLMVNCQGSFNSFTEEDSVLQFLGVSKLEYSHAFIHRSSGDLLKLIDQLDHQKFREVFSVSFIPSPTNRLITLPRTSIKLKAIIFWCVSSYRDMGISKEKVLIVCNALKMQMVKVPGKSSLKLRIKLENEIFESIFCLAEVPESEISSENLFVLLNELYQLKVITISAYLRKLIASGIFYLTSDSTKGARSEDLNPQSRFHLRLLQNLPLLNNRQCDHILRKWADEKVNFIENFDRATQELDTGVLRAILNNQQDQVDPKVFETICKLNVGLQFMVMNWFTSELRSSISKASKLIHITPEVVAFVYELFSKSNNLTAFFKVFIKFILKNENKVLIFYMDCLYFISRLILDHSSLLQFIAGNSTETVPASYDIYKLMVQDYKDLMSRESDMFGFKPLWDHISRQLQESCGNQSSSLNEVKDPKAPTSSFEYDGTRDLDITHNTDLLLQEVQTLASLEKKALCPEEYQDIIEELSNNSDVPVDDFESRPPLSQAKLLLGSFREHVGRKSEMQILKLLSHLRLDLVAIHPDIIAQALLQTAEENVESPTGLDQFMVSAKLIIALGLMSCDSIIRLIENLNIADVYSYPLKRTIFIEDGSGNMSRALSVLFNSARGHYRESHYDDYIDIIVEANKPYQTGNVKFSTDFLQATINDPTAVIQKISSSFTEMEILDLMSGLLKVNPPVLEPAKLATLVPIMSEFNLPIMQIVTSILAKLSDDVDSILNPLLAKLQFFLDASNSFFGELFNLCDLSYRVRVFKYMESIFMKTALSVVASPAEHASDRMIHVFKDFFGKINDSFVDKIQISSVEYDKTVESLTQFTSGVDALDGPEESFGVILDSISIFLRILIIEHVTLIDAMMQSDLQRFDLLGQLVKLLNSKFMTKNDERLQILLFDLLHLFKNSLTQLLTLKAEDDEGAFMEQPSPSHNVNQNTSELTSLNERARQPSKEPISKILALLDIPEPTNQSSKCPLQDDLVAKCLITLDNDELDSGGDVKLLNNESLILASTSDSTAFGSPFGEMQRNESVNWPFTIRSVQLIEETGGDINDGCVNLALLKAYTTKENVP